MKPLVNRFGGYNSKTSKTPNHYQGVVFALVDYFRVEGQFRLEPPPKS